jgi:hypothetical protein
MPTHNLSPFKLKIRNAISFLLGNKIARPFATGLAKAGLLGLGVGIHYEFKQSGEAASRLS